MKANSFVEVIRRTEIPDHNGLTVENQHDSRYLYRNHLQ